MSEEILLALMQFFAILSKQKEEGQDAHYVYVEKFLKSQLSIYDIPKYLQIYNEFLHPPTQELSIVKTSKKTGASVVDSIKILGICKKINATLNREQKVVVLIRLLEFMRSTQNINSSTLDILYTTADVFQIEGDDLKSIQYLLVEENLHHIKSENFCLLSSKILCDDDTYKRIHLKDLKGDIKIIRISEIDTFFILYTGTDDVYLNGLPVNTNDVYLLSRGSILKLPKDGPIYYSDVLSKFINESQKKSLEFIANNIQYGFNEKQMVLKTIHIHEHEGTLVALMGASGAGKTTLLNVLSGLITPTHGKITINGYDIHADKNSIKGVIGYIPQDDLLIEDLTVYENLFHNAQLCFSYLNNEQLHQKVEKVLHDLGLLQVKNIKVGNALNKKISGGQRKRLNIALELIREPSVLFVDEPTSGLSSRDSENVMDLLKELTLKGKLVFVVIHQPSSDIYKMFDKLLLLDVGGYPIYYGNPVEAIIYFKKKTQQLKSEQGECSECGSVNPELMFNLIEAKVVDEHGSFIDVRKTSPEKWNEYYSEHFKHPSSKISSEKIVLPESDLKIPGIFKQSVIFFTRDIKSKLANLQYVLINLLEAPLLALILSYIVKYTDPSEETYVFSLNKNIPAFIFMSIIVALFMALTLSAEEINKDKKILKREAFLNLSWNSYLLSKIILLFGITLLQTGMFIFLGKWILQYHDLYLKQWIMLFSIGCSGVLMGLFISSVFNSPVTIYILIPILLIPQMILSGAIFKFDELNKFFGNEDKVPVIADMMVSRWGYEALMTDAFTNNKYNKHFFEIDQQINLENYWQVYYIPRLKEEIELNPDNKDYLQKLINHEYSRKDYFNSIFKNYLQKNDNSELYFKLDSLSEALKNSINEKRRIKEQRIDSLVNAWKGTDQYKKFKKAAHNKYIEEVLTNAFGVDYLIFSEHKIIRKKDLIYEFPKKHSYNYRSHFFAPKKSIFNTFVETYYFNMLYIWIINLILYLVIRFKLMHKIFNIKL